MVRIAGRDLPNNKKINIALTYIYGIGLARSSTILKNTAIDINKKCKDLNDQEIGQIREMVTSQYKTEGDLRRLESISIKRLMEINSYRGKRHKLGLPLRGQRTRTNARTRKKKKKTIAGKKKAPKK